MSHDAQYTLVDVEERNREYPATFHIPPRADRESVQPGALVKLIFDDAERMWVEVAEVVPTNEGPRYRGLLRNNPFGVCAKFGDVVLFGPEHIANIVTEAEE